jgi:hypothetical protein
MKKILISAGVLLICMTPISLFAVNDAIDKGSFEFGMGSVFGLNVYKGNIEATGLTIGSGLTRFNVGYFIIDRLSIGGSAYYYNFSDNQGIGDSFNEFLIGPIVSYYMGITERLLFNVSVVYQDHSVKFELDDERSNQKRFGGSGALTFLLTTNLGLKGSVGIIYTPNYKDEGKEVEDTSFTQIFTSLGFTVFI